MVDVTFPLPAPENWELFEHLCADLLAIRFESRLDPGAEVQRWGRAGQRQHGIDIWVPLRPKPVAYQCKQTKALKLETILRDVGKASELKGLVGRVVFLTTAPADSNLQLQVEQLNASREPSNFSVEVVFWEKLTKWLFETPALLRRHYGQLVPTTLDMLSALGRRVGRESPGMTARLETREGSTQVELRREAGTPTEMFSLQPKPGDAGDAARRKLSLLRARGTPVQLRKEDVDFQWRGGLGRALAEYFGPLVETLELANSMVGQKFAATVVLAERRLEGAGLFTAGHQVTLTVMEWGTAGRRLELEWSALPLRVVLGLGGPETAIHVELTAPGAPLTRAIAAYSLYERLFGGCHFHLLVEGELAVDGWWARLEEELSGDYLLALRGLLELSRLEGTQETAPGRISPNDVAILEAVPVALRDGHALMEMPSEPVRLPVLEPLLLWLQATKGRKPLTINQVPVISPDGDSRPLEAFQLRFEALRLEVVAKFEEGTEGPNYWAFFTPTEHSRLLLVHLKE